VLSTTTRQDRPLLSILGPLLAAALVLLLSPVAAQEAKLSPEQQREFLKSAKVVASRPAGRGVTGSLRLTLSDGTTTHDAGFQSIDDRASDEDKRQGRRRAGERDFVDSYKYNVAAYELARTLGVDDMMPVTVTRRWENKNGSLTWWVDDVLMDEDGRVKSKTQPPAALAFQRERMRMFVFAELAGDVDRNRGNILYTKEWRVIMIDFSRAFRLHRTVRVPSTLSTIDRRLWERLPSLTSDDVTRAVGANLTPEEVASVMARRDAIIAHYTRLISEKGEPAIIY
jgi:hypothetical protein